MMLAFVLVVIVNGEPLADNAIFFRDVKRCNQFAHWISTGSFAKARHFSYLRHRGNVTAYCIPRRVPTNVQTFD